MQTGRGSSRLAGQRVPLMKTTALIGPIEPLKAPFGHGDRIGAAGTDRIGFGQGNAIRQVTRHRDGTAMRHIAAIDDDDGGLIVGLASIGNDLGSIIRQQDLEIAMQSIQHSLCAVY